MRVLSNWMKFQSRLFPINYGCTNCNVHLIFDFMRMAKWMNMAADAAAAACECVDNVWSFIILSVIRSSKCNFLFDDGFFLCVYIDFYSIFILKAFENTQKTIVKNQRTRFNFLICRCLSIVLICVWNCISSQQRLQTQVQSNFVFSFGLSKS